MFKVSKEMENKTSKMAEEEDLAIVSPWKHQLSNNIHLEKVHCIFQPFAPFPLCSVVWLRETIQLPTSPSGGSGKSEKWVQLYDFWTRLELISVLLEGLREWQHNINARLEAAENKDEHQKDYNTEDRHQGEQEIICLYYNPWDKW